MRNDDWLENYLCGVCSALIVERVRIVGIAKSQSVCEVFTFPMRLADSPSCIVSDEEEPSMKMQQMLRAMGQDVPAPKPTLEINPDHEIVKKSC